MLPSLAIIPFDACIFPNVAHVTRCVYAHYSFCMCVHTHAQVSRAPLCFLGAGPALRAGCISVGSYTTNPGLGLGWAHRCGSADVSRTPPGAGAGPGMLGKGVKVCAQGYP